MVAPILLPIILAAESGPNWFAAILTINMQIGLISPPVGHQLSAGADGAPFGNLLISKSCQTLQSLARQAQIAEDQP